MVELWNTKSHQYFTLSTITINLSKTCEYYTLVERKSWDSRYNIHTRIIVDTIVYSRSLCWSKNRSNFLNTRPISKFQKPARS